MYSRWRLLSGSGMRISTRLPIALSAGTPNTRSAARLNARIRPSSSVTTIASTAASNRARSSALAIIASTRSAASLMPGPFRVDTKFGPRVASSRGQHENIARDLIDDALGRRAENAASRGLRRAADDHGARAELRGDLRDALVRRALDAVHAVPRQSARIRELLPVVEHLVAAVDGDRVQLGAEQLGHAMRERDDAAVQQLVDVVLGLQLHGGEHDLRHLLAARAREQNRLLAVA